MAGHEAWVVGVGMMTPVGDSAAQTATSIRAGISRYQESAIHNRELQPMTMALLPEDSLPVLNGALTSAGTMTIRRSRMLRLAGAALREAVHEKSSLADAPIFLALPESHPDQESSVDESFLYELAGQSELDFDPAESAIFPAGRAAGLQALLAALEYLDAGEGRRAVVGGVDTYLDLRLLATLDLEGRVLADGVMDGFCPGEGAGFLLLTSDPEAPDVMARVAGPALAVEPGHRYSEEPYRGEGLAEAVAASLEQVGDDLVRTVFVSMNGENIGAKEWGVASIRNSASIDPDCQFQHPADCFGDTGAAVAPLLLGLASLGLAENHVLGPCLVCCSSDGELRGAAFVTAGKP